MEVYLSLVIIMAMICVIKYISEVLNLNKFRKFMYNFSSIKKYGNNIVNNMFNYYDKKI